MLSTKVKDLAVQLQSFDKLLFNYSPGQPAPLSTRRKIKPFLHIDQYTIYAASGDYSHF